MPKCKCCIFKDKAQNNTLESNRFLLYKKNPKI